MNFSDFSFWWVLLLYSVPFFTVRYLAKSLNLWQDIFDTVGLAVMSLVLFLNASKTSFVIFICEIVFNYLMVYLMIRLRQQNRQELAKLTAAILIVINIAILAYFKYLVFFLQDIIGPLIGGLPVNWQQTFPIPVKTSIPPGVSFYTFQMVAFVVDSLVAKKKRSIGFIDYINFVSFFPQVVAGPIERRADLLYQIESFRFKFTVENFVEGFRWLSLGAFMKFVLADNISAYIDLEKMGNSWTIWFQAFLFTLRIYFDFGGYSFIAVGLARFLGVKLIINFLAPYTSQSINEFWRRWHISLSTWFRDYVFLPLMGKNKQWAAFYLFITFTLSGFWHGAAWNFIIWGSYHGALLLILRYFGRPFYGFIGKHLPRPQVVSWALTFASVTLGCLFFMETNSHRLFAKLHSLITPSGYSLANFQALLESYSSNEGVLLAIIISLSIFVLLMEQIAVWQRKFEYEILLSNWLSPVLLGLTILLAANQPSQFIYFEF
jgi:D-alanyl-lipoteichoic acid acyltransferase DltB (MBOAT superfamily)